MEDFFKTFTSQDWLTFWLAAGALAVSLGSLVVAIGSLIQNHRFKPRPHFSFEWAGDVFEVNGVLVTLCRVWNDGDAPARNVRLTVNARGVDCKLQAWDWWTEVLPGAEKHGFEVPLEPCEYNWVGPGGMKSVMPLPGAPDPSRPGQPGRIRTNVLRPVVAVKYRGRWRKAKTKAPVLSGQPILGGC